MHPAGLRQRRAAETFMWTENDREAKTGDRPWRRFPVFNVQTRIRKFAADGRLIRPGKACLGIWTGQIRAAFPVHRRKELPQGQL